MSEIKQIRKRNGNVVAFDPSKILVAIRKAFAAQNVQIDQVSLENMLEAVVKTLDRKFGDDFTPSVEDIQDLVETEIMKEGFFSVAKSYILYRYEHTKERTEEVKQKIEEKTLMVTKRDGSSEKFSLEKLRKTLTYYTKDVKNDVDIEVIVKQCQNEIYDGIKTEDVSRSLVMVLRSLIERDPAYARMASRVLMSRIYKEVIGDDIDYVKLDEQYRSAFVRNIHRGIEIDRLDRRLLEFDLEKVAQKLVIPNDDLFDYLGLQTIYDRYFVRDHATKKVLETPQMFWMRVALGSALDETESEKQKHAENFYKIMSFFLYTPSTPTLFHAGTPKPQLSSCYLNMVPDSLDGIFKSYADNAQLSKWSGGIGTAWSHLRGTGAFIKGTGVESQGVIPFLKIANDVTVAINRSGRRRGAACAYLASWHYDYMDFLELRKNTGDDRRRTHDMNTASWIPDIFMKRVKEDGDWTFFSPDETLELTELYGKAFEEKYVEYEQRADRGELKVWKRLPAADVWKKMLTMLFETGHPWVTFSDPSNIRSPQDHVGVVHNSNLCTEITLNTSPDETAVCNLGSLNFAKFVRNGAFDHELVGKVVKVAMRMLDNVIDINFYPTEDSKRSNMRHRPVGLGIRGYQDALYMLDMNFDSPEAVRFADESMEVVSYYAILSSSELAEERGAYQTYKGSKWDRQILPQDTLDILERERNKTIPIPRPGKLDWTPVREHIKKYGMRNSNCLAVAPTATTANIVGCIPTIEPIYKNIYVKSNQAGDFVVMNKYLVQELKNRGLWSKEMLGMIKFYDGSIQDIPQIPADMKKKYKEVFEIDPRWLIESAAHRGKWIDQSQSLNVFFHGASGKALSDLYFYAWELGLKTTYYLRTLGASQVEKSTVNASEYGSTHTRKSFVVKAGKKVEILEEATTKVEVPSATAETKSVKEQIPSAVAQAPLPMGSANIYKAEDGTCESCEG